MDPDEDRTDVAAGIAVQSEIYFGIVDTEGGPFGESYGIAQLTETEKELFGLTCNLNDVDCAISGMTERIDRVLNECKPRFHCSAETYLVAAALTQNGGFDYKDMQGVLGTYTKNGKVAWVDYFDDRAKTATPSWRTALRGLDYHYYDTRHMVSIYTENMLTLNDLGWTLPWGLTVDQVIDVQDKYGD